MKCNFCQNKDSILTPKTCCTGCDSLKEFENELVLFVQKRMDEVWPEEYFIELWIREFFELSGNPGLVK